MFNILLKKNLNREFIIAYEHVRVRIEEITVKQDVSRNISGIETGALMVLWSPISGVFIPISNPQHDTTC